MGPTLDTMASMATLLAMVLDTEASMERERLRLSLRLMPSSWLLPTLVTMATMATLLDMAWATLDTPTLLPMAMETLAMLDMAMVLDTEASMERERLRPSLRLMPSTWLLPTPVTMATMAMLPPMLATLLDMAWATLDTPTQLPLAMETLAMLDMAMVLDTGDSMERERLRPSPSLLLPMLAMVLDMAMATLDIPTLVL